MRLSDYAVHSSPASLLAHHRPGLLPLTTSNGDHDGLHLARHAAVCNLAQSSTPRSNVVLATGCISLSPCPLPFMHRLTTCDSVATAPTPPPPASSHAIAPTSSRSRPLNVHLALALALSAPVAVCGLHLAPVQLPSAASRAQRGGAPPRRVSCTAWMEKRDVVTEARRCSASRARYGSCWEARGGGGEERSLIVRGIPF